LVPEDNPFPVGKTIEFAMEKEETAQKFCLYANTAVPQTSCV
jgi:hypothetical protein